MMYEQTEVEHAKEQIMGKKIVIQAAGQENLSVITDKQIGDLNTN